MLVVVDANLTAALHMLQQVLPVAGANAAGYCVIMLKTALMPLALLLQFPVLP